MSTKITEPARQIDVIHNTDVLVVGSGPGGLAAALAAARAGVQVTLVERFGCFGGNITTVGVEGFAWYRHEQTVEAGGIGREFEDRAKAAGAAVPESQSLSYELDSEGFKLVADALVEEAGITPMLHRLFVAPIMEGNEIKGIITESKAGREAILAKRIIDATGDADIAHRAGAPVTHPPREDLQAASVMFHLAGVDKAAFMADVREQYEEMREDHYASLASRKFLTLEKARDKMLVTDWKNYPIKQPKMLGTKVFKDLPLKDCLQYIDWNPFFQVWQLRGIGWRMPITMTAFTIGAISMIGVPPTAGFVSKWYITAGAFQADNYAAVFTIIVSTALNAAYFLPIIYMAWFQRETEPPPKPHGEAPWPAVLALSLTAFLTLVFFFFNGPVLELQRQVVAGMS